MLFVYVQVVAELVVGVVDVDVWVVGVHAVDGLVDGSVVDVLVVCGLVVGELVVDGLVVGVLCVCLLTGLVVVLHWGYRITLGVWGMLVDPALCSSSQGQGSHNISGHVENFLRPVLI